MAAPRYQTLVSGIRRLVAAITTSAGAGDGEKIVATNTSGVLDDTIINAATTGANKTVKTRGDGTIDPTILPTGVGPDTASIVASEALAANDLVNVWNDAGTPKVRKADATTEGKEADGFVLASVVLSGNATVYFEGRITGLSGLTPGATQFLATSAGLRTETVPSAAGNVVQVVGKAISATAMDFEKQPPITLV